MGITMYIDIVCLIRKKDRPLEFRILDHESWWFVLVYACSNSIITKNVKKKKKQKQKKKTEKGTHYAINWPGS